MLSFSKIKAWRYILTQRARSKTFSTTLDTLEIYAKIHSRKRLWCWKKSLKINKTPTSPNNVLWILRNWKIYQELEVTHKLRIFKSSGKFIIQKKL